MYKEDYTPATNQSQEEQVYANYELYPQGIIYFFLTVVESLLGARLCMTPNNNGLWPRIDLLNPKLKGGAL